MTLTHDQFMLFGIAIVFIAIAGATWLASLGLKIIDIIVGVVALLIFAWILVSYVHF